MTGAGAESSDDPSRLDQLFAEYLTRIDRGEKIDRAKFLRSSGVDGGEKTERSAGGFRSAVLVG